MNTPIETLIEAVRVLVKTLNAYPVTSLSRATWAKVDIVQGHHPDYSKPMDVLREVTP